MLYPEYLFNAADDAVDLYEQLNTFGINDICRRLVNTDFQLGGSAEWQYYVLQQSGLHQDEINAKIAQITGKSAEEIKHIFQDASYKSYMADKVVFDYAGVTPPEFGKSDTMLQLLDANYRATQGELKNLTRTTADASNQLLIKTLDDIQFRVQSGMQSKEQAVIEAIDRISEQGLMVKYASGAQRSIESVVRMCVTTGINKACAEIAIHNCTLLNTDLVITSSHPGARLGEGFAGHVNWQGGIYSISGTSKKYGSFREKCGWGNILGICGINCRHSFMPYMEGMKNNFKRYDSEEDKELYKKQQKQRYLERNIRNQKRKLQAQKQSIRATAETSVKEILQENYDKDAYKLKNMQENYKKYCSENNLTERMDRTKVAKYGQAQAREAVQAGKRYIPNTNSGARARYGKDIVYYDENKPYRINLDGYGEKINAGLSRAAREVAKSGSENMAEYCKLVNLSTGEIEFSHTDNSFSSVSGFYDHLMTHDREDYAFIHNHNTKTILSLPDLQILASEKNVKLIVAVRNDGIMSLVESNGKKMTDYIYSHYENEMKEFEKVHMNDGGNIPLDIKKEIHTVKLAADEFGKGLMQIE